MELFRLLGKIAVDNAEARRALQETSQEGEKTESKLSKAFGAMGKGAAVMGKAIATGLAAGATACVGLATAAIKSYGDYEQLVGGVETLFGTRGAKSIEEYADMVGKSVKDVEAEFGMLQQAQSDVMNNAAKAYETAGLSVNEYMESVNGIAAALNQSSASQLESAALADQAVIDMSDNAAKMGTSMEAIQNAYAGFSKQNYTMLDNLNLGYGGTTEEMQRMHDDASKISGIKYDISSFADVTQAIHVMQEEMGIAGTTAKEASGTIQGSFGMLKGSWSNLMTGLSDPEADLQALINNVFSSVTTFAGNLVPRITQVFSGIATAFKQLVPMITKEIPNLLNQVLPAVIDGAVALVNGIVSALPSVIDTLMTALPMLIEGIMTIVDALIGALPQIMQSLLDALPTILPQLIDAAVNLFMMLVEMLPQIIQPIIDALPTIIVSITDALLSNLPVLIQGVGQLIVALAAAIPQVLGALWEAIKGIFTMLGEKILGFFEPVKTAISNAWAALGNVPGLAQMKQFIETVWGAIKSHISTVINAVKNVVTTVWNAIKNNVSTVLNAIKNVIQTAWNAVKTIISNVMKLISSVLKGDWEGVKKAISNILNAIKSVIKSIWDGIKNTISSVLNGIKSIVSSIWNGIKSVISSALNTIKTVVSSAWNGIKSAISNVLKGIVKTVKSGAKDMLSAGKDLIKGIWNGISGSLDWIKGKVKGWVGNVTKFIKKLFGINSPSTVMRDEVGRELAAGAAVGIEKNISKVQKAAEEMNQKVLDAAQKRVDDYKVYNNMTLAEEAGFWDEVRHQIAEGTDARIKADQKYLEAKKSVDDQILTAEQTLQSELDEIAKKVTDRQKSIMDTFDLFGSFDPKNSWLGDPDYKGFGSVASTELLLGIDAQINALEKYNSAIDNLESRIGGSALLDELKSMGVGSTEKLQYVAKMTDSELQMYSRKYDEMLSLAGKMAKEELAPETIAETQKAYEKFATTCNEMGVEISGSIADSMGNAVATVTNSLDLIRQAFEAFAVDFDLSAFTSAPTLSGGSVVYSINSTTADGSGKSETGTMSDVFASIVEQKNMMAKLIEMLTKFFPEMIEAFDVDLFIDGRRLATELAPDMDDALGIISSRKERGR